VTPSIVPQRAIAKLRWASDNPAAFDQARASLCPATIPEGYSCETRGTPSETILTVTGRAAHSGMNLAGGRNALVLLANVLNGRLESSPAASLLEFAAIAGEDLHGAGLGIDQRDPLWGQYGVNVAMFKPAEGGKLALSINLRRIPPMNQAQIKEHLTRHVAKFTEPRGLKVDIGGFFGDEPFIVPPDAKLVRRLLAAFERATGTKPPPAIAGGGTYAKRLPNAIAFGMWFPGTPYPGHDVDERILPADLHRGVDVLLEALNDLAYSAPIDRPLVP
jgi:succinyl-diaminopimelate desuccinylase